jgi:hypothetical protein
LAHDLMFVCVCVLVSSCLFSWQILCLVALIIAAETAVPAEAKPEEENSRNGNVVTIDVAEFVHQENIPGREGRSTCWRWCWSWGWGWVLGALWVVVGG